MIYPGDIESAGRLLRQARRLAFNARIDGIPYREYWGEVLPVTADPVNLKRPKYRLLLPEDEEEVEKLRYDLYYIKHRSPWLDLRILFETVMAVVFGRGTASPAADPARGDRLDRLDMDRNLERTPTV